jgi:hypothetical protein
MSGSRWGGFLVGAVAIAFGLTVTQSLSGQPQQPWPGMLDEHPAIQYATRATTDRVARLRESMARSGGSFHRDARTGYLAPVLRALGIPVDSQILVFSKTGVQRGYIGPHNPRALYFDQSVTVGYVPGAPLLEIAAHDPQQGVIFYTLDQTATEPVLTRRTNCLGCHITASTLNVPGLIVRSNFVADDGTPIPEEGFHDVTHQTPHPDRWGGYFVTSNAAPAPYGQRAHLGNITFSGRGITSDQIFIDWINSSPETRGYLSGGSDIISLLLFDHQNHAINLLTKLNWESRVAASQESRGGAPDPRPQAVRNDTIRGLVNELADYLLFVGEAPPTVPLTPLPGLAEELVSRFPKDRRGRSCAQMDLVDRLMRYPCSYMVYSEAFDGLPAPAREAVYQRMLTVLSGSETQAKYARLPADERRVALEILRDTKPDFPGR